MCNKIQEQKRYTLGLKLVELGTTVLERLELRELARPHLKRLMEASCEVAHLVILQDLEAVYIEKVEYPGPVKMASRIGGPVILCIVLLWERRY